MRSREITVFSASFLDLLSCGLGAVILLCLVFAASRVSEGRVRGETTVLRVRAVPPQGAAAPRLGVAIELDGLAMRMIAGDPPPPPAGGRKANILPQELGADGLTGYSLLLSGERFGSADRAAVFLFDFADATRGPVVIEVERHGKGPPVKDTISLQPGAGAYRRFSLEGLESEAFRFRWDPL